MREKLFNYNDIMIAVCVGWIKYIFRVGKARSKDDNVGRFFMQYEIIKLGLARSR